MDIVIFLITPVMALSLRLDGISAISPFMPSLLIIMIVFSIIKVFFFYRGDIYTHYWRYASVGELSWLIIAWMGAIATQTLIFVGIKSIGLLAPTFPLSVPLIDGLLGLPLVCLGRYSVRLADRGTARVRDDKSHKRVLVIGAGAAGVMIVKEMQHQLHLCLEPVGFVDDDVQKHGSRICGLPVLGGRERIPGVFEALNVRQVLIAMPSISGKIIREIVSICAQAGIQAKIIPGMYEVLDNRVSINQIRNVQIEDLLRREPVQTDGAMVEALVSGKRVLITGGGGSIGSELCRQLLRCQPSELIVLGHGENSVFETQNELRRLLTANNYQACTITGVIADIRFPERMQAIFEDYRPELVFHAAAHKHVPLMEMNPGEAITNNIMGTHNLLNAALATGVERFVMISSDKAVNPTSVMGAAKRVSEYLVHRAAKNSGKPYVAVRFGNVLGSRGSVVLTFKQQIARGGPLTITDPNMTRFFMTIPEAVQLVLQAAVLGHGGEVFMLDMGEPIKIVDLARDMIKLSGLELGHDIDIAYTGLRPGEKMYEELFLPNESYVRTRHEKIFIASNATNFIPHNLDNELALLAQLASSNNKAAILAVLKSLVPEFQSDDLKSLPGASVHAEANAARALQTTNERLLRTRLNQR
ncbi:MAG: polysaccharide biosynthesis protein [Herpetosiphonaceae bacterium]|nr:polysaccharide biosynthesis protein [Herpetosiphonaceae bacterium]